MNKLPDEKPKRKPISKKLRFEVFKRDNFTCRYCGRKAPDVVLEVDHIEPVSKGGKNSIINLVTSCRECNRGKGKNLLTEHQMLDKERNQLEILQQTREQMRMMMQWKDELLQIENEQIEYIEKLVCDEGDGLTDAGRKNVGDIIKRFGFDVVIDSAIIAKKQYRDGEVRMKKLGGIAWNITHKDDKK